MRRNVEEIGHGILQRFISGFVMRKTGVNFVPGWHSKLVPPKCVWCCNSLLCAFPLSFYKKSLVTVNESSERTQFWVTIATTCRVLPRYMNVNYVVGHEWATNLLFLTSNAFLWNQPMTDRIPVLILTPVVTWQECDYRWVFDWWSDLLDSLIQGVTTLYNLLLHTHSSVHSRL
jgi:hypothetical protein